MTTSRHTFKHRVFGIAPLEKIHPFQDSPFGRRRSVFPTTTDSHNWHTFTIKGYEIDVKNIFVILQPIRRYSTSDLFEKENPAFKTFHTCLVFFTTEWYTLIPLSVT